MGELVPSPVVVTAAIVGFGSDDRVIELIEYPAADVDPAGPGRPSVTRVGITHVGMLCDDIGATRAELESRGVEFLTAGIADVAGLRTTWCHDPWGTVIILMEKSDDARPYWGQMDAVAALAATRRCESPVTRPLETSVRECPDRAIIWHKNLHSCPERCALQGARRPQWAP